MAGPKLDPSIYREDGTLKQGNELNFPDGLGPRTEGIPDQYPSDWHYAAHLAALEANVDGLKHRAADLEAMEGARSAQVAAAKQDVKDAEKALADAKPKEKAKPKAKAKDDGEKRPSRAKSAVSRLAGGSKEER